MTTRLTHGIRLALLGAAVAGAAAGPAPAYAQQAPAGTETLGEIVVTAEKRESTEQRTAIAMSVFTPETLAQNNVATLQDLTAIAPSVSFGAAYANAIITVRGVSSRDTTEIGDPAVAVNIDGLYYQRAIGLGDSIYDLERVEVLRGPQGTLYGRNATGGAINFVTAKPKKEFGASASVTVGNYDTVQTEGMVNLPFSDRVQLRAAFFTRKHDGYANNAPARDGDDADSQAARVHLAIQPTDALDLLFTAEKVKLGGVGVSVNGLPLVFDGTGGIVHDRPAFPADERDFPHDPAGSYLDATSTSFRTTVRYDAGLVDVTYVGGYRRLDYQNLFDLDGTVGTTLAFQQNEKPRTKNHELRISSKPGGVFEWQVGGFYFQETNDLLTYFQNTSTNPAANLFTFAYPTLEAESKAAFGQGSFAVTDALKVEVGVRHSKDDKKRVGSLNFGSGVLLQDASSSSSKTTYHAAVNWQATPSNLYYVKYDTGYKAGGFTDAAPYDPESIKAVEIGAKNRFGDDRYQLNLAAYYYDYSDQQISQFVGNQTFIRNAGTSETYGLEIEGAAILTPNDRIDGYVSYMHSEFTDFAIADAGGNVDLAGNRPPQAPRTTVNFGYEHAFDLSGGRLTARVQTHYESVVYNTFFNYDSDKQDAYTRSDLLLTYEPNDAKWSIQGYLRNIEDETVLTNASEQPLFGTYVYQYGQPRTYGVRVSVNW